MPLATPRQERPSEGAERALRAVVRLLARQAAREALAAAISSTDAAPIAKNEDQNDD